MGFEISIPFKSSKRDPEATAYLYELSQPQIDAINKQMEPGEKKAANIKWIFEADLKSTHPWKSSQKFLFETESAFRPPKFSNDFRASLKKIVAAKNNGKLVVFAGAGVSVDSNVPAWKVLIEELKNDLATDETEFTEIAAQYYQARGEKEYHERVQEILRHGKTKFNPVHRKITELRPVHIITTNYDTHFEQILEDKGLPYSLIRADSDLPYSKGSSLYVKMHGDFGLRNMVLRKWDYTHYDKNFPLILSFIRETFASKLVLFVGFSFSDANLQQIFDWVGQILQQNIQRPYLFNSLDSVEEINSTRASLEKKGVRLLQYESALDDYFDQVKGTDDEAALKLLSAKSQSVYKFLKVIQEFDLISDSLENREIENQFIHSMERFDGLGAIPLEVLCATTPFKLKQHPKNQDKVVAEFNYDPFHLETLNEEFLTFLNHRKNSNGQVDFRTYVDMSLPEQEQKINLYLKLLHSSGVHCIRRRADTQSHHLRLNPINKSNAQCNCARCLHDRLEIKKLISSLNSASAHNICKSDFHDEGLLEAYGYLKTGQIIKAFYALEDVRRESLKSQKYIGYFIASYNQTLIRPMLWTFYESNYSEDDADRVREKVESLDLYQILSDLPVARDIRRCLQLILENDIYRRMLPRMEDEFEEIRKTYVNYRKSGSYFSSGPLYWYRLHAYFFLTWNFYHKNLLFTDENYTFSKMAHLYLEGMVASYATSPRYGQRLTSFSDFFARVFIQYGYASDTTKLLKDYEISDMTFEHGPAGILKSLEEFLESSIDRTSLFGDRVYPEVSYHELSKSARYFSHRITRTFNNFLVLMMHVGIPKSDLNRMIGKMIDFLGVSELFGASNSHQHFSAFIKHHIKSIDDNNLQKLGFYILSDNIWSGSLIAPFCNALITVRKAEHIFAEDFYIRLLRRIEQTRQWTVSVGEIIPFYALLKPAQQQKFSTFIENKLTTGKGKRWDLINKAYHWQMWNPDKNREIFQKFFDYVAEHAENFPEYQISDDGHPEGENFQPWNDLIITVHMIHAYKLFDRPFVGKLHDKIPSNMFRWILKPDEFDYGLFEMKWLLVFSAPVFLETLKGNLGVSEAITAGLKSKYDTRVAELFYTRLQ